MFVPVVSKNQKPLMPTTPARAARWIRSGKATPFWRKGIFCVRLNIAVDENVQEIVLGVDPGSKREGLTVKSRTHTYLNVLSDAADYSKEKVRIRRCLRRGRRFRKTPYRKTRANRTIGGIPPSTKSRWQLKLRIIDMLRTVFCISCFSVEDIRATTKQGKRRWNKSFSPLEVGKQWFYGELSKRGAVHKFLGYDTYIYRQALGLKKSSSKLDESFDTHNVDSWLLSNRVVGGHWKPENTEILRMVPLNYSRRQLHRLQFSKGGQRSRYGGTMSLGLKKGSVVKHKKYGVSFVGGSLDDRLSLHKIVDGSRQCQNARLCDIKFLSYSSFRCYRIAG